MRRNCREEKRFLPIFILLLIVLLWLLHIFTVAPNKRDGFKNETSDGNETERNTSPVFSASETEMMIQADGAFVTQKRAVALRQPARK